MFGTADFLAGNRVVFDIKGNAYRLVAQIKYAPLCVVFIRFVGTHAEYDRIDAGEGMRMIQPIADDASHKKALRRAEQLWDAEPGSNAERELDALATLIDVYEQRAYPIEALGPLDAIKARCEYLGWTRRDLEPLIGSRARVSEVLAGRRPLTLAMIRRLHEAMDIPAEILIAEVSLPATKRPLARAKKRAHSARNAAERGVAANGHLGRASRSLKARS